MTLVTFRKLILQTHWFQRIKRSPETLRPLKNFINYEKKCRCVANLSFRLQPNKTSNNALINGWRKRKLKWKHIHIKHNYELWLFNNWASSSFTPLGQDKTCSAGIFVCQNSHLQLKIKTGTTSLQAVFRRLLAIFLVYSFFCISPSFHFEIPFSFFSF